MKELAAKVLCTIGAPALGRRKRRHALPILMYHGVVERPLEPACWHQLGVASFRRQMEWVARRYQVVPLSEALAALRAGTLAPRSLALTFDDGYRNVRTVAAPVLEALGLPATVYLVTDVVGTNETLWPDRLYLAFARTSVASVDAPDLGLVRRRLDGPAARASAFSASVRALKGLATAEKEARLVALLALLGREAPEDPADFHVLTWDDVAAMRRGGLFAFGGHSTRHEILARMPDGHVARAIGRSHETVADRTGVVPVTFAYPNGRAMDFDDRSRSALTHLGVRFALSTAAGLADAASDPLALPRVSIGSDLSLARFRLLVSGVI